MANPHGKILGGEDSAIYFYLVAEDSKRASGQLGCELKESIKNIPGYKSGIADHPGYNKGDENQDGAYWNRVPFQKYRHWC
jgi:hypothetical protein